MTNCLPLVSIAIFVTATTVTTISGLWPPITDGSTVTPLIKGKDVQLKVGSSILTLKDAATGKNVFVVDADDETLSDKTFYSDRIVDGDWVSLASNYKEKTYATEDIPNVDASAVTKALTLTGDENDNEIIGTKGSNVINGGGGLNIFTGGKGADTFVYGGGSDTITDYGVGNDKISLGTQMLDYEIDEENNLTLNVDSGSVTILDGVDKKINFVTNGKTSANIFTAHGIYNTLKTALTLNSATETFTADKKLVSINGGLTNSVEIVGNTKNNKIFGGAGDDTLNGLSGNNTLTGNGGSDVFIFERGKTVITDYTTDSKIYLGVAVTNESVNNKGDVILKSGSNALTVKKFSDGGQTINFADDTSKTYFKEKIVDGTGVTLLSSFGEKTYTAEAGLVDASRIVKKFSISGGNEDNTIIGGRGANFISGDGGDNILIGGKGKDTLWGGDGSDTFIYKSGDGADVIKNFGDEDFLEISGRFHGGD